MMVWPEVIPLRSVVLTKVIPLGEKSWSTLVVPNLFINQAKVLNKKPCG
jgi:hypothetical protein